MLLGLQDALDNKSARLNEDERAQLLETAAHKMSLYADKQAEPNTKILPNSVLIFDMKLVDIQAAPVKKRAASRQHKCR
ncbi:hypothetical protein MIS46_08935 [Wielerella bovis]|uniref:hypothetical protein n=1 Tax=Wielerella bovis TaxID=2917790 RepID=UPI0020194C86|nr:hypothetical protein [Wielerella bovis]ULJ62099.1 hypothetical protein MIS46_08935 [Wielerella bovis]